MKNRTVFFGIAVIAIVITATSFAWLTRATTTAVAGEENGTKFLVATDANHLAVMGYDVVAYFTDDAPTPGSDEHVVTWRGANWRFANADHRAAFESDPQAYAPQYGGYCAWGVAAKDDLFEIDPEAWKIVDNKLYLNFNKEVQGTWLEDIAGFIDAADNKWPALVETHAGR